MTAILFFLNAVFAAVNIGLYESTHHPASLAIGVFCGTVAVMMAIREWA